MMREPNLVIIGAQKAGTTSLHHYLSSHPKIFMSHPVKEPGYFMTTKFILRLFSRINRPVESREEVLERHMLRGYEGERYFGEGSTYYTVGRQSELHNVPARMKRTDPAMRLIYIVRNPMDRLVSHYLHTLQTGLFEGDMKGFVTSPEYTRGLRTSRYWLQLRAYLKEFPRQQIKVVLFEDLVEDSQSVVDEICLFLELERAGRVSEKVYNRSEHRASMDAVALAFPPKAYREAMRVIEPDVLRLGEFMGRDLKAWDLSVDRWCRAARDLATDAVGPAT